MSSAQKPQTATESKKRQHPIFEEDGNAALDNHEFEKLAVPLLMASLLYSMFKSKTKHPLHAAVRLRREDVVFLYLIEHSQEVREVA